MAILLEDLGNLIPIGELKAENRNRLAEKGQIMEVRSRQSIEGNGNDRWLIYLLDGSMRVTQGTQEEVVSGNTPRAHRPLFTSDRQSTAVAQGNCRLLRLDRRLFDIILREQRESDYEVEDTPISEEEGKLLGQILHSLSSGTLALPSMPEVAMRIRDATLRPEITLPEIARIVQIDPAVAAGIMRAANTVARRGAQPATNLTEAVLRLGLEATRSLAISLALTTIFQTKQPNVRRRMHALWEHSVQVSALCQVLAGRAKGLDPSHALLAGLLHDIGGIPILQHAERYSLQADPTRLEHAITNLRVPVGLLIIDHWELSNDLQTVVQGAEDWFRNPGQAPDYADLAVVAQLILPAQHTTRDIPENFESVPAFAKLGLSPPTAELIQGFLSDAQQEISEVKALLAVHAETA